MPRRIKVGGIIYIVSGIVDKTVELAAVTERLAKLEDWYVRAKKRVEMDYENQKKEILDDQSELQNL